eukprot:3321247-Pyramimonas_sp.AAC.1
MDAQCDVAESAFLSWVLQEGGWNNVSNGYPDQDAMTYGRDPNWKRRDPIEHTSRIDYIFANDSANAMVIDFQIVREFKCPGHLGLE